MEVQLKIQINSNGVNIYIRVLLASFENKLDDVQICLFFFWKKGWHGIKCSFYLPTLVHFFISSHTFFFQNLGGVRLFIDMNLIPIMSYHIWTWAILLSRKITWYGKIIFLQLITSDNIIQIKTSSTQCNKY